MKRENGREERENNMLPEEYSYLNVWLPLPECLHSYPYPRILQLGCIYKKELKHFYVDCLP
jgi:hypothetical protein